jgi:hypothetical protein
MPRISRQYYNHEYDVAYRKNVENASILQLQGLHTFAPDMQAHRNLSCTST